MVCGGTSCPITTEGSMANAMSAMAYSRPCDISAMPRAANARRLIPHRSELRATASLALPMVLVQVGIMAMGFVDTLMVGHVSGVVLAAVALGNIYFFNITIFGMG